MNRSFKLSLLLAIFFMTTTAAMGADVSLTAAGSGRFSINGTAMDGVAGIKFTIGYDSSILSAPVVSSGGLISSATMVPNTTNPGSIIVAIVSTVPFKGSGQIISLTFASKGESGGITSLNAEMIDMNYATVPVRVSLAADTQSAGAGTINNPFSGFTQNQTTGQQSSSTTATPTPTTTAAVTNTAAAPSIGTISLPGEEKAATAAATPAQPTQEYRQQEQYQPPPPAASGKADESAVAAKPEKKRGEIVKNGYPAVLDRFKEFKGERQLAALVALFTAPVADEARQEPALAVSDGKQTVRITAGFAAPDDDAAPNFATTEARIIALKPEEASGRWLIDLLPAQGTVTASVSILRGNRLFEVPLTLVPPAQTLTFSVNEISAFLKDYAATKPLFDLNGDGKHDYIDDYIYCGHYRLSGKTASPPKAK